METLTKICETLTVELGFINAIVLDKQAPPQILFKVIIFITVQWIFCKDYSLWKMIAV